MRRIVYLVHVSVDGYIEGPNAEFDWPVMDPELSGYAREVHAGVDTLLYGRVVWQMMNAFWPRAEELSDHPHVLAFAPLWRRTPKVVVSRTLPQSDSPDVRVLSGDLAEEIGALKSAPGKDVLLTGGTELASALAALDLIDDFLVFTHPVILGGGRGLFLHHPHRTSLDLAQTRTFDGRVTLAHYTLAGA